MKRVSATLLGALLPALFVFSFGSVGAQFDPLQGACDANTSGEAATACAESELGQEDTDPVAGSDGIITTVANVVALATAVVAVIIIIVAGITTALSSGDAAKVKSSRDAIIYAAVGLVVVALARSIVVFVINRL